MDIYRLLDLYKAAIDERRPFEGEMLAQLKEYYRIGLTWSSNALEGNTLTESETKVLLEDGLTVGGKPLRYTFEAIGHAKAYDFMFTLLKNRTITERDVLTMHQMFYENMRKNMPEDTVTWMFSSAAPDILWQKQIAYRKKWMDFFSGLQPKERSFIR